MMYPMILGALVLLPANVLALLAVGWLRVAQPVSIACERLEDRSLQCVTDKATVKSKGAFTKANLVETPEHSHSVVLHGVEGDVVLYTVESESFAKKIAESAETLANDDTVMRTSISETTNLHMSGRLLLLLVGPILLWSLFGVRTTCKVNRSKGTLEFTKKRGFSAEEPKEIPLDWISDVFVSAMDPSHPRLLLHRGIWVRFSSSHAPVELAPAWFEGESNQRAKRLREFLFPSRS
jgi:hypothetical protein